MGLGDGVTVRKAEHRDGVGGDMDGEWMWTERCPCLSSKPEASTAGTGMRGLEPPSQSRGQEPGQ